MSEHQANAVSAPAPAGLILVADDDPAICETLGLFLQRQGFSCEPAHTGDEVLDKLKCLDVDVLITDIDMPGNRSFELIKTVAAEYCGLPIVVLTAHPSLETATRSVEMEVQGYLVKPFNEEQLRRVLAKSIIRSRLNKAILNSQHQLQLQGRELQQISRWLHETGKEQVKMPLQQYLRVTMDSIIGSLLDFRSLIEVLSSHDDSHVAAHRLLLLEAAIVESVAALRQSKHHFRSPQLAELRQKLEALLDSHAQDFST